MITRETEAAALFTLLRRPKRGVSWADITARVSAAGSAREVLDELESGLFADPQTEEDLSEATAMLRSWASETYGLTTVLEPDYPSQLRDIREMPPFLFYRGDLRTRDEGMSVVGSRNASERGLNIAGAAAEMLVDEGLTVIAGLAAGIDARAHRAALRLGGRTVAVIGTGIDRHYPASHAHLQDEISDSGLVLSQFYPDAPPTKQSFPMRNATMSGYGLATIVIEAGEHSGTRIQARVAGKHGRPVILTSNVVDSTAWGRELAERPSVYVAGSIGEMQEAVRDIRSTPDRMKKAIDALVTSR